MSRVRAFFGHLVGWVPSACRSALSLSGEQRQTLMSWGLLLGVVVLTASKLRQQRVLEEHWREGIAPATETALVSGLFTQMTWDTLLQGVLALGVVAIARGGSMAVSITKGGVTMDFQASGAAAKSLAQETVIETTTAPATPAAPDDDGRAKP